MFVLNTSLLFALANLGTEAARRLRSASKDPEARLGPFVVRHGLAKIALAYPGMERSELELLLEETAAAFDNEYEPYTEFRPRPRQGRFVNVSGHGFRHFGGPEPWPPEPAAFNVFVFGGSTTFGIGLPDAETIPARLASHLPFAAGGRRVRVYNFGRPAYVSPQERILFEQLLVQGAKPELAIFIDGLNEFYIWPRPFTADVMGRGLTGMQSRTPGPGLAQVLAALPIGRFALALWRRLETPATTATTGGQRASPAQIIADWRVNRRQTEAVAREFGVRTLFVWQPVPCYAYDVRYHLFFDAWARSRLQPERMGQGYEIVARGRVPDEGFLWLADIQASRRENLYVTAMHYGPALATEIAARISRHVLHHDWLGTSSGMPAADRAGEPRS